jgi:hypothetical protein
VYVLVTPSGCTVDVGVCKVLSKHSLGFIDVVTIVSAVVYTCINTIRITNTFVVLYDYIKIYKKYRLDHKYAYHA